MSSGPIARLWTFTINNPQQYEDGAAGIDGLATALIGFLAPHTSYLVFQLEKGEQGMQNAEFNSFMERFE